MHDGGQRFTHRGVVESESDRRFRADERVEQESSGDEQEQTYQKLHGFVHNGRVRRAGPAASTRPESTAAEGGERPASKLQPDEPIRNRPGAGPGSRPGAEVFARGTGSLVEATWRYALSDPESRFEQPWYPEFHRLLSLGWKPLAEESREWDRVVVFGSRQKEETRRLLDRARRVARDLVYLAVPNEYGGKSWKSELEGVQGEEVGRKSRLFVLSPLETELAVEDFGENSAGFTSTPGLFSWDKIDRGSELLAGVLSEQSLRGPVVDLGAGWGYLPTRLSPHLEFHLVEADRRGLVAAEANLKGRNVHLHWADASDPQSLPPGLKGRVPAVITNPPFHTHKKADPVLGGAFVATAGWLLKKGGACYLVGNSHLPYAKIMEAVFSNVEVLLQQDGFKVYRGLK